MYIAPVTDPLLYDTHMHTPLCRHAEGEPEEYAAAAAARGLRGIVFTCHNPVADLTFPGGRMAADEFDQYVSIVARAAETWRGRVDVRLGLECDYYPGAEPLVEQQVASADLEYVLGSVHPGAATEQLPDWQIEPLAAQIKYFNYLVMAAESGLFDCLSHPDLIKNFTAAHWDIGRVMDHICDCLDRIAATGIAMELNTSGWYKPIPEANPGPAILEQMAARQIPVVVGSDAHQPHRVGDRFETAYEWLIDAGYRDVSFFLGRTRQQVPIESAIASLNGEEVVKWSSGPAIE